MVYACLYKFLPLILWLIQSHYQSDTKLLEYGVVIFGSERTVLISLIEGSTKSYKFLRQNPVKISIFNFFVVLIFLHIEGVIRVPTERNCELKSHQAVLDGAFVGAGAHSGITERYKLIVIGLECVPSVFS